MDALAIRALVVDRQFQAHGVAITVTPVGGAAIQTRGIWLTPAMEDVPRSADFQRREPRRILALPRAAVPSLPVKSDVLAPDVSGGAVKAWKVDGFDRIEADQLRVIVVATS